MFGIALWDWLPSHRLPSLPLRKSRGYFVRAELRADLFDLDHSVAAILTPKYVAEEDRPQAIDNLNSFGSLVVASALHHHIYEFRAQLSVYESIGLDVPNHQSEEGSGFEGRREVSYCSKASV